MTEKMTRGRTPQWRRFMWVGATLVAIALAANFIVAVWPRAWDIEREDGSIECTIRRGWTLSQVTQACGAPRRVGGQPKLFQGFATFCSAPCELHGRRLLFYDCDGRLYRTELATAEYQGCEIGAP